MSNECIFCKIINGDIPANIINQNEYAMGFRDINPQSPTHVLIIPKIHISSCQDLNKQNMDYFSEMVFLAQKIADKENVSGTGYRWVVNKGDDGGQTVGHLHLHLLGGRSMSWPPG